MAAPAQDTSGQPQALAGFTIGITAARRAEDLAALLVRKGAAVLHGPSIRIIPVADDTELEQATEAVVAHPPDIVVATTGIGFRGWVDAAESWGESGRLVDALRGCRVLSRGPKTTGAIRAAGLREEWSPQGESAVEVAEHLVAEGVAGKRIAVQLHGTNTEWEVQYDICAALRDAGAEVLPVPVYRWLPPADLAPMDRLIETCASGGLDAVTFTSAPAVASVLSRAKDLGIVDQLRDALRSGMLVACVGPVTAGPLEAIGVPTAQPTRARLGALARFLVDELPSRVPQLQVAGAQVSIRGQAVVVDGELKAVPPAGMALLHALARQPGRVLSMQQLLAELPGNSGDTHAVEAAVGRLRAALGQPRLVQTVVKRGYRLAVEPV
ncbi:uroporphyrinogen-III synthase [Rhodococcus sp. X156]|uniref:uroporphyrinogen-III synthase n=1 Tax=Rhodococcus sp. X156 TaxID=2499145 RepID=UPI000FD989CB|nr:uroporphyrinogen-III synthase [Rhodococcus sp. X156]